MLSISSNLGFPCISSLGEAHLLYINKYRNGQITAGEVKDFVSDMMCENWEWQKQIGIDHIPSGDMSIYGQVMDMVFAISAIPDRFKGMSFDSDLEAMTFMLYGDEDKPAMNREDKYGTGCFEVTPELSAEDRFELKENNNILSSFKLAKSRGILTRPSIIGPVSFTLDAMLEDDDPLVVLPSVLYGYTTLLKALERAGAKWVQINEPAFITHQDEQTRDAMKSAYATLSEATELNLFVYSFFGSLGDNLKTYMSLPVRAVHLDLVNAMDDFNCAFDHDQGKIFSLGLLDVTGKREESLSDLLKLAERAARLVGLKRVMISPNGPFCSGAKNILPNVVTLTRGLNEGRDAINRELQAGGR